MGRTFLRLADLVASQKGNVSTDLISAPETAGLQSVVYGWRFVAPDDPLQAHWVMSRRLGRLEFFAADGDVATVQLELSLPANGPRSTDPTVLLNGQRVSAVTVGRGWSTHDLEVPPGRIHSGRNFLDLEAERVLEGRASRQRIRLRRVRFRAATGRPSRGGQAGAIRVLGTDAGPPARPVVEMPVASFVDAVVRLPRRATLAGALSAGRDESGARGPVDAYVRLLDEQMAEHTLVQERMTTGTGRRRVVAVDLSEWAGQLVRIRWGATGPTNGSVRWHGASILSPELPTAEALPPIERTDLRRSGRLGRPTVILILLDAARADAFSPFGGPHPTPALDRLAADGTVFTDTAAPSSWTGQSVPAILTGLSPDAMAIGGWGSQVPEGVPTLGELAADAGYRTVLWSQHPFYWGVDLHERFGEARLGPENDHGALPRLKDLHRPDRPSLSFVHLLPPHAPYNPPAPFFGAYTSWYKGAMSADTKGLHRAARQGLSEEDVRFVADRYLEHAAYADHLVGLILEILDRQGLYDEALVALLSDHGEGFMEHGRFLHTLLLHREFLHVPLIIKWPASVTGFRRRVTEPVSLLDVVPTLVDGLALPGGSPGFMGRSLLPLVFDGKSRKPAVYAVTRGFFDEKRAPVARQMLQLDDWRILYAPLEDTSQVYRADQDPDERVDLAGEEPLQALRLRQAVLAQSAWARALSRESTERAEEAPLDPEIVDQLEALGYVN